MMQKRVLRLRSPRTRFFTVTHGLSKTDEHRIWRGMNSRCNNPNDKDYARYGGRGIEVCTRWAHFENFYKDMGPRPSSKHTLDRKDNDGNYESSNCRWATRKEQAANTRNTKLSKSDVLLAVRLRALHFSYNSLGRIFGVDESTMRARIKND